MLQLVKKLRSRFQGREMSDADILNWANRKIRFTSRKSRIESFKVGDQLSLSFKYYVCHVVTCLWDAAELFCLVVNILSNSYVG